jgi:hypothetical protein
MDTDLTNPSFSIDGIEKYVEPSKFIRDMSRATLFSGSIDFINASNVYVFNFVNGDTLLYILNEVKDSFDEVKIEIQTHARHAEEL